MRIYLEKKNISLVNHALFGDDNNALITAKNPKIFNFSNK